MNLPQWEMRDVLQFAKTEMKQGETESTQVVVNNYQIQEEDGRTYYEIYESVVNINEETTEDEFFESVIKNEMLVKEYKTLKGLINNLKKQYTQQFNYNILTTI
ncbi:hypothetical protein SEP9_103 [Staphylococcus phage vB_SepS_SEP9]|uniref:Uncharacterized protein n=1 Tax=Staphylococcus phage vB_SepS_SEP9 TaxID=1434319 RepID=W5RV28_9CAUD|nr:hypothetical protein SEP9_103 [Staphylococcus phage vB_SepS_SEP9]AHG24026.1 hypothetical protein SEP9_103 [Staphylococcus phage vB_SepS_SEP9]MDU6246446.1 hypothetical protein [Staphylococcus lugdunensis]MDU6254894.1 hypothetical protein [Staphylococcus warneri]